MVPGYAQADLAVDFEAAARGQEAEARRAVRVGGWQDDAAVVDAVGVGGRGRAGDGEVPFEEVGVEGGGVQGGVRVGGEFAGFLEDAFDGGRFVEAGGAGGAGGGGCAGRAGGGGEGGHGEVRK